MRAREGVMRCDTLNASARELRTMLPFVNDGQSDSGALDNVMELLVRTGRDIPEVMMMLIPEAWQNDPLMDEDRRAFYQCAAPPAPLIPLVARGVSGFFCSWPSSTAVHRLRKPASRPELGESDDFFPCLASLICRVATGLRTHELDVRVLCMACVAIVVLSVVVGSRMK